jgi:hypothetical protein
MNQWDGKPQAPTGLFRVLGEDEFEMPPAEYWIGDFGDYDAARQAARERASALNSTTVYDDQGKARYIASVKAEQ